MDDVAALREGLRHTPFVGDAPLDELDSGNCLVGPNIEATDGVAARKMRHQDSCDETSGAGHGNLLSTVDSPTQSRSRAMRKQRASLVEETSVRASSKVFKTSSVSSVPDGWSV